MKTLWINSMLGALLCLVLLSFRIEAQQPMTTEQLLENGQNENAYAAAMFVAGWIAGTAEQMRLHAEDLRAAGAANDRIGLLDRLTRCLDNDLGVADLWTALRAALQESVIDLNTPASAALNRVAAQACINQQFVP